MSSKKLSSIIVSEENKALLEEALAALKGRSKVFPDADEILFRAAIAEGRLDDAGVAVSNRPGCLYKHRKADPMANAYKYTKKVERLALKRTGKGWIVAFVGAENVYPKQGKVDRIDLTPRAKDAVIRAALAGSGIFPQRPPEWRSLFPAGFARRGAGSADRPPGAVRRSTNSRNSGAP